MEVNDLLKTTDANTWATEFIKVNHAKLVDFAMMLTWFANAIESGREAGIRQVAGDPAESPFWRVAKKPLENKTKADRAMLAAIIVMSTRGDLYVPGSELPCSAMTMEEIFEDLVRFHEETMVRPAR